MTICQDCDGRGEGPALVSGVRADGTRFCAERVLKCSTCGGTGEVSERHAALIETGKRLRNYRVEVLKRSGREEAKRLALDPILVNYQEHGRRCAACCWPVGCPYCPYTPAEAEEWALLGYSPEYQTALLASMERTRERLRKYAPPADFDPFAQDPSLGPVEIHADPAAPLEPEDWPEAFG